MSYDPLLALLGLAALATPSAPATFAPTAARGAVRVDAAALPSTPGIGDLAIDSTDANKLKWYDGSVWQNAGGAFSGIGGTIQDLQVAFGSAPNTIQGSPWFTCNVITGSGAPYVWIGSTTLPTNNTITQLESAWQIDSSSYLATNICPAVFRIHSDSLLTTDESTYILKGVLVEVLSERTVDAFTTADVVGSDVRVTHSYDSGFTLRTNNIVNSRASTTINVVNAATATDITSVTGMYIETLLTGAGVKGISYLYGLYITDSLVAGSEVIPNRYGIYQAGATTNNKFEGSLTIGGSLNLTPQALPTGVAGLVAIDSADANKLKWYDGSAWQAAGGGTIGGSISATQIAYGSGANTIAGSAALTFTASTGSLTSAQTLGATDTSAVPAMDVSSTRAVGASGNTNQIGVKGVASASGGFAASTSTLIGGSFVATSSMTASATAVVTGVYATASHTGTGTLSELVGARVDMSSTNTSAAITASYGAKIICNNNADTVTTYGAYISLAQGSGGTAITNRYTLYLNNQGTPSISGVDYAFYQAGAQARSVFEGQLYTASSSINRAGLNLPDGVAPTTPISGDLWSTGTIMQTRQTGTTQTFAFGTGAASRVALWSSANVLDGLTSFTYDSTTSAMGLTQAVGATASSASPVISVSSTRAIGASGNTNQIGIQATATMTGGFTPATSTVTGGSFSGVSNVSSTFVGSATPTVTGVRASATHGVSSTGGIGSIAGADISITTGSLGGSLSSSTYGVRIICTNQASVPSVYGAFISLQGGSVSTSIANRYALYIENLGTPVISGTDYAIYQANVLGVNYFAGLVSLDNGLRQKIITTAANATIFRTQIAVKQTASGITTTLWASPVTGDTINIRNASGGSNTVAGNGTNIEGAASQVINNGEAFTLIYDGSQWTLF